MANYTINDEISEMRRYFSEQLPNWEKATAEMLLTALTNCDNQQVKESVALIKISSKSQEMMILLDFALSMIRNNPTPIRESIYDTATDGIRELNQHRIDKYRTNQNEKKPRRLHQLALLAILQNTIKVELKKRRLIY